MGCLLGELQALGPDTARAEEKEFSWSRSGLGPIHISKQHTARGLGFRLSTGRNVQRWDCPREKQSQVWPQKSAMGFKACCTPVTLQPVATGLRGHPSARRFQLFSPC